MALASGTLISHYRIASPLGAGGMGEVYLARDQQLDRDVALKILPPERHPEGGRRFLQEARLASALSHPNVAHIYEFGEDSGLQFIAMEYVDGRTLLEKADGRPLPVGELIEIALQVAAALGSALPVAPEKIQPAGPDQAVDPGNPN